MSWGSLPYVAALTAALALLASQQIWRRSRNRSGIKLWAYRGASGFGLLISILALLSAGWTYWYTHRPQPMPITRRLFQGVTYVRDVRHSPRPMVIHAVKIDLRSKGLRFLVTPDDPNCGRMLSARKTTDFVDEFGLQLAINANYFFPFASNTPWDYYPKSGEPVDVVGTAASNGRVYSPKSWGVGTFYLSRDNKALIDRHEEPIYNAIAGNGLLLKDGRSRAPFSDEELYPRAALALDREGRFLILLVIDLHFPQLHVYGLCIA